MPLSLAPCQVCAAPETGLTQRSGQEWGGGSVTVTTRAGADVPLGQTLLVHLAQGRERTPLGERTKVNE